MFENIIPIKSVSQSISKASMNENGLGRVDQDTSFNTSASNFSADSDTSSKEDRACTARMNYGRKQTDMTLGSMDPAHTIMMGANTIPHVLIPHRILWKLLGK